MKCDEFERFLADALGDELADADRPAFEAHLAECERCRREYETARAAVRRMRSLSGPQNVTVRREGDRLTIRPAPAASLPRRRAPWWMSQAVFRYAASILVAFAGGYALHAGLMIARFGGQGGERAGPAIMAREPSTELSFRDAVLQVHERNPHYTDFAKCVIAMRRVEG